MPTQSDTQRAAAFQDAGLNFSQQGAAAQGIQLAQPSPVTPPTQTMDAGRIANNSTGTGFQFPSTTPDAASSAASAAGHNASIPTPDSIIQGETAQTPAEATNQGLLQKLAKAIGSKTSLATLQTQQEASSDVPHLTSSLNDLNSQLEGLNNQATDLQNRANPGGAIENQEQMNAQGRGITAGGLAPLQAADLRKNQIQQSAIASQALTVKSAVYAAQGKLSLAKDAADKSAQVQFDAEQQQIDYMNALIKANEPQMTKEEKAQADLVTAKLADRQNLIDNAKQDKVTGIGLAAAAMKNNPNDPTAQYNAQQVLKLDPSDPNYLSKVSELVGKYQQDPNDVAMKLAQIQASRASTASSLASAAKTRLETQQLKGGGNQAALEKDYRSVLLKEVSSRSGGLGLQDAKVNQAIHLKALADQYKSVDTKGNPVYNIPTSQYYELAIGLATLVSGSNTTSDTDRKEIAAKTAAGDLKGALQYVTGTPQNGNTQSMIKNLVDSIDRQGTVAQQERDQYTAYLHSLAPSGLNQDRVDAMNKETLNQYVSDSSAPKSGDTKVYNGQTFKVIDGKWVQQ